MSVESLLTKMLRLLACVMLLVSETIAQSDTDEPEFWNFHLCKYYSASSLPSMGQMLQRWTYKYDETSVFYKNPEVSMAFLTAQNSDAKQFMLCDATSKRLEGTAVYRPWPSGVVPYSLNQSSFSAAAVSRLEQDLKQISDKTCVQFRKGSCASPQKCLFIQGPVDHTRKMEDVYTEFGLPSRNSGPIKVIENNEVLENLGFLPWALRVLGIPLEHNRYDRDLYVRFIPGYQNVDMTDKTLFYRTVRTKLAGLFPYDQDSAMHMTQAEANSLGFVILSRRADVNVKDYSDGMLSNMDIEKINYLYCGGQPHYNVSTICEPDEMPSFVRAVELAINLSRDGAPVSNSLLTEVDPKWKKMKCREANSKKSVTWDLIKGQNDGGPLPIPWPGGVIPYSIAPVAFNDSAMMRLEADIAEITKNTPVRFQKTSCLSHTGRMCIFILSEAAYKKGLFNLKYYQGHGFPVDIPGPKLIFLSSESIERFGFLSWALRIVGLMPEHNRFDRNEHVDIIVPPRTGIESAFTMDAPNKFSSSFPYDHQSGTHITPEEAKLIKLSLKIRDADKAKGVTLKERPDGRISQSDIKKISLLYQSNGTATAVELDPCAPEKLPSAEQALLTAVKLSLSTNPTSMCTLTSVHNDMPALMCRAPVYDEWIQESKAEVSFYRPDSWPGNVVPYWTEPGRFSVKALERIDADIAEIGRKTTIKFRKSECKKEQIPVCLLISEGVVEQNTSAFNIYITYGYPSGTQGPMYVYDTSASIEKYGFFPWIMRILGITQEHNRHDRDKHISIAQLSKPTTDLSYILNKNAPTYLSYKFPYDSESITHLALDEASRLNMNLTSKNTSKAIKQSTGGKPSLIDIQKIYFLHDRKKYNGTYVFDVNKTSVSDGCESLHLPTAMQALKIAVNVNKKTPASVSHLTSVYKGAPALHCKTIQAGDKWNLDTAIKVGVKPGLWPGKRVRYWIQPNKFSSTAQKRIDSDLTEINRRTPFRFVKSQCQPTHRDVCLVFDVDKNSQAGSKNNVYTTSGYPTGKSGPHIIHDTSTGIEKYGFLQWGLRILGITSEHNRYDRDAHVTITHRPTIKHNLTYIFTKNAPTYLSARFPYDHQSASHLTLDEAMSLTVTLRSNTASKKIKTKPDGHLSTIDVQKIYYLYDRNGYRRFGNFVFEPRKVTAKQKPTLRTTTVFPNKIRVANLTKPQTSTTSSGKGSQSLVEIVPAKSGPTTFHTNEVTALLLALLNAACWWYRRWFNHHKMMHVLAA